MEPTLVEMALIDQIRAYERDMEMIMRGGRPFTLSENLGKNDAQALGREFHAWRSQYPQVDDIVRRYFDGEGEPV